MSEVKLPEITPERLKKVRQRLGGLNTPVTVAKMGALVDSYWEEVRRAPEEGKKVAWVVGLGTILTNAAGMVSVLHAAYGPYCTARRAEVPILDIANTGFGFLPDTCSYLRLCMGLLHAWDTGQIDKIAETHRMPKPDLVIGSRVCSEHSAIGELVARHANCPYALLDADPTECHSEAEFRKRVAYVERQIKEDIIPLIEQVTGRPYDYDKLSEMLAIHKRVAMMRSEVAELMKNKPSPATMFDLGISVGTLVSEMGRPETEAYYGEFLKEIKDRVAKGIGVTSPENYRIYWDGYSTWAVLGTIMRIMGPRGGIPIMGRYISGGFWPCPEAIDPERPVWSIASNQIRYLDSTSPDRAGPLIMDTIRDYSVDACVFLSFVSCRMWNVGQEEWAGEIERRFGIPSLIFDADMIDRTFIDEARLRTRIEALLETVDARRRRWV